VRSAIPFPLAEAVPETALTILKFCFLALIYLFLWRVVRVVVLELRAPALADAGGVGTPRAPTAARTERKGARLRILEPPEQQGEVYPLGDEITVGRGGGCGIVLTADQFVSTVHARVFRRGDDVFVEDLGSRNGTFVNGERVTTATQVRRGDRVQFGQTVTEMVR
jgi:pSer/pThr/pTyr-binding forkhead associated (FHA) protein